MGLISEERRVKSEERREKSEERREKSEERKEKSEEIMEQFAYRNLIAYQKDKEVVMQTYVERDGQPR